MGGKASRTQRIQTLAGAPDIEGYDESLRDRQAESDRAGVYREMKYIFVVFVPANFFENSFSLQRWDKNEKNRSGYQAIQAR
jgi:hypothetical protein